MRNHIVRRQLSLILLAVSLSGCALSPEKIASYPAKDVHVEIRRLMVVATVTQYKADVAPHGMRESAFETAFRDALGKCGIDARFLFKEQLSAIADSAEAVRTFSPDALLALDRQDVDDEQSYSADVIVMSTKKIAWRADIVMHEGRERGDGGEDHRRSPEKRRRPRHHMLKTRRRAARPLGRRRTRTIPARRS